EARWKEKLVYGKDGGQDLLTLFGDACFIDHEQHQELQADLLKVWLEPADPNSPPNNDQSKRRPQRVDALGRVTASSPDLRVHDTETLVLYFKDRPATDLPLPAASTAPRVPVPDQASGKMPDFELAPSPPGMDQSPTSTNSLKVPADAPTSQS